MDRDHTFKPVFTTPFFQVEANSPTHQNDEPYYRLRQADSVICCVLDNQGRLILVQQDRPNLGYTTLEFPAGAIEPEESPQAAAQREFLEETGLHATLFGLGAYRLLMHRFFNQEHIFFGMTSDTDAPAAPEQGIEIHRITRNDFINKIKSGDFEQLAGLGILQAASLVLGIDVLHAPIDQIRAQLSACIKQ